MCYQNSLWIGAAYRDPENYLNRVLVMGHSTYGTRSEDPHGIKDWINRRHDQTFSTFYGHLTGLRAARATRDDRQKFFDRFAFTNFVSHILGEEDRDPTEAEYERAALDLPEVIRRANPVAAFVFGLRHQWYSLPVIEASRIRDRYRATVHPVMDGQGRFLPAWREFVEMLPSWREEEGNEDGDGSGT